MFACFKNFTYIFFVPSCHLYTIPKKKNHLDFFDVDSLPIHRFEEQISQGKIFLILFF